MLRERRQTILNTLGDSFSKFIYYDRKEDDELPVGAIEAAIKAGEITVDELVEKFRKDLTSCLALKL